jgi:hypothetical protein
MWIRSGVSQEEEIAREDGDKEGVGKREMDSVLGYSF